MKRILLAAAMLAVLAAAADAALTPIQTMLSLAGNGIPNKTADGRKPIAVVTNNEWETAGAQNTFALTENDVYGSLWSLLREQGQQVDFIPSKVFRPATAGDNFDVYNIWRYLGNRYSVVIVRDMHYLYSADVAYRRRFFCPDSTNCQVINVGTMDGLQEYFGPDYFMGTGTVGGYNDECSAATVSPWAFSLTSASGDSLLTDRAMIARAVYAYPNQPVVGTSITGQIDAGLTFHTTGGVGLPQIKSQGRAIKTAGTSVVTDPVWVNVVIAGDSTATFQSSGYGGSVTQGSATLTFYPPDSTHHRVSQIVQLFKPPSSGAFNYTANGSDNFRIDATLGGSDSLLACYSDSVATHYSEALPIAWRTYWSAPSSALAWLGNDVTTSRFVDYMPHLATQGQNLGQGYEGMYLYALISRYARLDPIKRAYVWDNCGEWGVNKIAAGDTASIYPPLWPSADSLKAFHDYVIAQGVPPDFVVEGSPDSLYTRTTTTQGLIAPYTFLSNHRFSAAMRDTTTTDQFANPFGISTSPAGVVGAAGLFASHRRAFIDSSAALAAIAYKRWGIYQRLMMADSAYAAKFGPGHRSPYISIPFDWSAPVDMRLATTWAGSANVAGNGQCPPESLLMALALSGKTYVRGWTSNLNVTNAGLTPLTGSNISSQSVTSTTSPLRFAPAPDASYNVTIPSGWDASKATSGNTIVVRFIGNAAFTEPGITSASGGTVTQPNSRKRYSFENTVKLATLFGTSTPIPHSYPTQAAYGEAALGAVYSTQSMLGRSSDIGRCRIVNQWPQYLKFPAGTIWTDYQATKEHARVALFSPIAALNNIAGHPIIRWVQPWQVYDK